MNYFKGLLTLAFLIQFSIFSIGQNNGVFYQNGITYLPDGSGVNYSSIINISGFPTSIISSSTEMATIKVNMEHSYIGDLEMWLECPNGSQVELINSYVGGAEALPGGFSGGSVFLGNANDAGSSPGIGWDYIFSSVYNSWDDMELEYGASNYVSATISGGNSMNPNGVYLPETTFDNLIGCPVDGDWTLFVRDNLGADDGYIFG